MWPNKHKDRYLGRKICRPKSLLAGWGDILLEEGPLSPEVQHYPKASIVIQKNSSYCTKHFLYIFLLTPHRRIKREMSHERLPALVTGYFLHPSLVLRYPSCWSNIPFPVSCHGDAQYRRYSSPGVLSGSGTEYSFLLISIAASGAINAHTRTPMDSFLMDSFLSRTWYFYLSELFWCWRTLGASEQCQILLLLDLPSRSVNGLCTTLWFSRTLTSTSSIAALNVSTIGYPCFGLC